MHTGETVFYYSHRKSFFIRTERHIHRLKSCTTGPKEAPRDRSRGAVFFYCYLPLIVFGVIMLIREPIWIYVDGSSKDHIRYGLRTDGSSLDYGQGDDPEEMPYGEEQQGY